ncbi:hypothetical protein HBI25_195060 [Parastagonospora nodorum]|nr:hypothetical protein HBI03_234220 [Parastagonospora nodorum]KAH4289308.1 hypothetical protein HBI01_212760 [Parastagonospora nodorum]KAH4290806.1 hypothetical protein HBI02_199780 [Parastagonospora nodorum]KAH4322797.1 hypothetical protein HBI00_194740 [Parastagonospora nodorum]KAH4451400.1 hypothetical protein HBH90_189400 [Parastagonospora nodorum]
MIQHPLLLHIHQYLKHTHPACDTIRKPTRSNLQCPDNSRDLEVASLDQRLVFLSPVCVNEHLEEDVERPSRASYVVGVVQGVR